MVFYQEEKQKYIEDFRRSGQTQAAFARANGINPKTLSRWINQANCKSECHEADVEFIEVKRAKISSSKSIKIRKSGIEIEIPSFDVVALREVLNIVKAL